MCSSYRNLLDREEERLDAAFRNMMPEELPSAVVEAAEAWPGDAYDNIILAQDRMAARREEEEERVATLEDYLKLPDGETLAERARRLWILRALQQTSCVSHMAREVCDDSTKANWSTYLYREYRRLLDAEMMAACQIYAETKLADLLVRKGKEAKGWLTSVHKDAEYAQDHNGARLKRSEKLKASWDKEATGNRHFMDLASRKRARDAAYQARLQASRMPKAATKFSGSKPGEISFTRPRDRNKETVAQGTFVGGLTGAALRQVRRHAAIIAWMRSTMSPTSRIRLM
jgi:hypothetical protein